MVNTKLNISYLGKRDYVDVSSLCAALYEAWPEITDNKKMKNFGMRLIKKVTNECFLVLKEAENIVEDERTVLTGSWEYEGKTFNICYQETDKLLTARRTELIDNPVDLMKYENGEVLLFNPINNDSIYNFMKMGRLIIVNKYNLFPRVVRFRFARLLNQDEMKDVIMKASPFGSKNFYRLETFKDNEKFGEIIIKGLTPY